MMISSKNFQPKTSASLAARPAQPVELVSLNPQPLPPREVSTNVRAGSRALSSSGLAVSQDQFVAANNRSASAGPLKPLGGSDLFEKNTAALVNVTLAPSVAQLVTQKLKGIDDELKLEKERAESIANAQHTLSEFLSNAEGLSARYASQASDPVQLTPDEASSLGRGVTLNSGPPASFEVVPGKYPVPSDGLISKAELAGIVNDIVDDSTDLSSDADLSMLQLQSLVSQREAALSMATNLMKDLNDGQKTVAQNVGK